MSTTRGQHLIGQVIGSYILEKLLGYGGSSAVFLAQNRLTIRESCSESFSATVNYGQTGTEEFLSAFST